MLTSKTIKPSKPMVIGRLVLVMCVLLVPLMLTAAPAYADDGGPGGSAASKITKPFYDLGKLAIEIILSLSVVVYFVAVPKGFLSAGVSNMVGSMQGVSQGWLNIIHATVIFVIGIVSFLLTGAVMDLVRPYISTGITIPNLGF